MEHPTPWSPCGADEYTSRPVYLKSVTRLLDLESVVKKNISLFLVILLFSTSFPVSTLAQAPKTPSVVQAMEDPLFSTFEIISLNRHLGQKSGDNRDPDWDWTLNTAYELRSTAGTFHNVRLPYYANSGPAAALLNDSAGRDIAPEDGWELVLRDFGPGIVIPYFILYNKYRGILRFFYYSTLPQSFSHAIARLSYQTQSTSRTGAHFTFLDQNRYVSNYDPARSQIVVGSVAYLQWAFFDFDVSGYDPGIALKSDPTFVIEIAGVTETDLTATGEVDLITGPVNSTKSGGGFNIAGAYKNVMKRHKDVKSFKSEITSLAESAGSAWWAGPLNAIKNLTDKSWFSALGPVAGFLEFVIGGGSRKSTLPAPLATKGSVQLKGTLTTQSALYQLIMRVPGSHHLTPGIDAASNVLPLYDQPLGVLNVSKPPVFTGTVTTNRTELIPTGPWSISSTTSATTPLQVVYNTAVFANANVTVAWTPSFYPAYNYTSVSTFNSGQNRYFVGDASNQDLYVDLITGAYFSRIGIKARLTPHNAASGLEPVTLYKVYNVFTSTNLVYDSGNGGGGGGGGGWGGGGGGRQLHHLPGNRFLPRAVPSDH